MAFTLELEEWVGSVWHRFITRRASADFPEARVVLPCHWGTFPVLDASPDAFIAAMGPQAARVKVPRVGEAFTV